MARTVQYAKNSIVYFVEEKDDKIYLVQNGIIGLTGTDIETKAPTMQQVNSGEFFGVKSALGHFPREETATVLADSQVIVLTIPEFEQVFCANEQLILKTLKVFSTELRNLHRKTELVLKSAITINRAAGMFDTAKSFYEDAQYQACIDICSRLLTFFPKAADKDAAEALLKNAKLRQEKLMPIRWKDENDDALLPPSGQFALPTFERFAKQFEAGSVIIAEYEPGDTFYLIRSGLVQSVKCVNGTKKNLDIHKQGEIFGEMSILEDVPRSATCVALTHVDVLEFKKENFDLMITGNPAIAMILLKLFCRRIYASQRRFKILCISDLSIRIADVFLMFDEMNPVKNPNEKKRVFDLTVQDIAHWAGIPVETARSEINKYSEAHRLEVFNNHITIANIADIRRIVESRVQVRTPA